MAQTASKKKKVFDGRYEILAIVGRGSGSVVYHARHIAPPHSEVALKVLINKKGVPSSTDQLRKEALAMVSSRHKYTVRLDDFHSVGQLCYLAMEYASEGDLRRYQSKQEGLLPIAQAERFLMQIAEALAFIHQAGILHRDIKPENILVINPRQVRLADFGVAVLPGEKSSIEDLQKGVGTMDYMAPEVLEATASNKGSDVYLLGATFYEILTGVQPFANIALAEVITARHDENITPIQELRPDCPAYLANTIQKAIAFNPQERFRSARELYDSLLEAKITADSPAKDSQEESTASQSTPSSTPQSETLAEDSPAKKKRKRRRKRKKKPTTQPDGTDAPHAENRAESTALAEQNKASEQPATDTALKEASKNLSPARGPMRRHSNVDTAPPVSAETSQATTHEETTPRSADSTVSETVKADHHDQRIKKSVPSSADIEKDSGKEEGDTPLSSVEPQVDLTNTLDPERKHTTARGSTKPTQGEVEDSPLSDKEESPVFEDFSEDDFYASATKTYKSKNQAQFSENRRKKSPVTSIIFIVIGLFVADYIVQSYTDKGLAQHAMEFTGMDTESALLPLVSPSDVTFPNVPVGMYHGIITGLVPGVPAPLSFTRVSGSSVLAVSVGLDGWQPALVDLTTVEGDELRVRANGYILNFSGTAKDGVLQGTFENSIAKTKGTWSVQVVTE